jgi:hypothetical protein
LFKRLIGGLARNRSGIVLLTGAAAVLSGVERVMGGHRAIVDPKPNLTPGDRFRIYRTNSEIGYTYWVLQGFGTFSCFALFDSWEQAIQEANRRVVIVERELRGSRTAKPTVHQGRHLVKAR